MYLDRDISEPVVGDWAEDRFGDMIPEHPHPDAWLADLPSTTVHRARAAYYGLISHIDHQINRLTTELRQMGELDNTIILFTSDHGDMLGDHYLYRKSYAYEGSARIPILVQLQSSMREEHVQDEVIDRPVGLDDVMPTLLEAAGIDIPDTVEGQSMLDLLTDRECEEWRQRYRGEHGPSFHESNACQYLVGDYKYIWNPITGDEQLFDLERDPDEETDLANNPDCQDELEERRRELAERLAHRPEGFSDGETLQTASADAW